MQGDGATNNTPPLDTLIGSSGNNPGQPEEVIVSPVTQGVGDYYPRAIYFATTGVQYTGTATVEATSIAPPVGNWPAATFDNYQPPVNIPGTTTPYPRRNSAAEPSIGINWNTDNVMTMSRLVAHRTTFDDSTSPPNPVENTGHIWFPRNMPAVRTGLDPIGFTDTVTGRSLFGELSGSFTNGVISDDDLSTVVNMPTQGITAGGAIDHQSIGGGPPNPSIVGRQPITDYPHMVYYASQNIGYATAATSLDGGLTYLSPASTMYTLAQCSGIHGHIRVAADGTVYVPNKGCAGKTGVVVSQDNGLTWNVRTVPSSTSGHTDPSIGIGSGGRLYLGYTGGDNHPHAVISDDKGLTWRNDFDLALAVTPNMTAAAFSEAVAGDNNRAAIFFLATTSTNPGDPLGTDNGGAGPNFAGTWYPYIATTYDGGASWTVAKADNDPLFPGVKNPVQQGVICTIGTTCPSGPPDTRNLADFNEIAVDSRGRILTVYADGCNSGHPCMTLPDNKPNTTTPPTPDDGATRINNEGSARLTIIRQRGGLGLFAAFDPGGPAAPLLSPPVDVRVKRSGNKVSWAEPDNGGSRLTEYRVYRGIVGGSEKMIARVRVGRYSYLDQTKKRDAGRYYYRVTAVNAYGESPRKSMAFPNAGE